MAVDAVTARKPFQPFFSKGLLVMPHTSAGTCVRKAKGFGSGYTSSPAVVTGGAGGGFTTVLSACWAVSEVNDNRHSNTGNKYFNRYF